MPELYQPLMVVVLMAIARAASPRERVEAVFSANGRAANIARDCSRRLLSRNRQPLAHDPKGQFQTNTPRHPRCARAQPKAFTTASPIWAVPTFVVPALKMSGVRRP
jgi:hypothetical protein